MCKNIQGTGYQYFRTLTFFFKIIELILCLTAFICSIVLDRQIKTKDAERSPLPSKGSNTLLLSLNVTLVVTVVILTIEIVLSVWVIPESHEYYKKYDILYTMITASILSGVFGFCGQYANFKNTDCFCYINYNVVAGKLMDAASKVMADGILGAITGGKEQSGLNKLMSVLKEMDTKGTKTLETMFLITLIITSLAIAMFVFHAVFKFLKYMHKKSKDKQPTVRS